MEMWQLKIIAAGVVFLTGLAGGLLSWRLQRSSRSELLFSLGSALAGGIFLGAGLIHMLPDAVDGFAQINPKLSYPLAFTLCAFGFVCVLFLEKVLLVRAEGPESMTQDSPPSSEIYPYLLATVLSFHSVLAGLALGAETSLVSSAVIFVAIIAHKGSAGFALGVGLLKGGLERGAIVKMIVAFALATPLGILAGTAIHTLITGRAGIMAEAIFDCLAAGTFLYIAVLDIIQEEFFDPTARWLKFFLLLLGLGGMALLALWL